MAEEGRRRATCIDTVLRNSPVPRRGASVTSSYFFRLAATAEAVIFFHCGVMLPATVLYTRAIWALSRLRPSAMRAISTDSLYSSFTFAELLL